ncbi:MAG: LacI family DNA-binding transcriptional regulator [Fuerstiella sp.]
MATIQDIAKRANVSKATVSRVINNTTPVAGRTRDAVVAAMKDLKFQPNMMARSLAGGRSMTVGIVTQKIGSPFYDTIAQGVISGLSNTGYSPILVDGQWESSTSSEVIATLLGRNVDGLILIGGDLPAANLQKLHDRLPTVLVARELKDWSGPCVHVDNETAGYRATRHLIQLGHRSIAVIRGIEGHPNAVDRVDGYRRALDEANIPFNDDLIVSGDFSAQSGILGIEFLLNQGIRFTGVFAANDMAAFGARLALHRNGLRVPEDVSVVGFDDQAESAFMTPPLTTMRQPATEMGQHSAAILIAALDGRKVPEQRLEIQLVSRESVARMT